MGKDPGELRREIDRTRAELGRHADELNQRVRPGRLGRRTGGGRGTLDRIRAAVMGNVKETAAHASQAAQQRFSGTGERLGGTVSSAGERLPTPGAGAGEATGRMRSAARERTEGTPLAAGLIAFGVGWLAAGLAPASRAERRAGAATMERAGSMGETVREELRESAETLRDELREPARQAAEAVRERAGEAAGRVRAETFAAGDHAAGDGREAAKEAGEAAKAAAKGTAQEAARRVQDRAGARRPPGGGGAG